MSTSYLFSVLTFLFSLLCAFYFFFSHRRSPSVWDEAASFSNPFYPFRSSFRISRITSEVIPAPPRQYLPALLLIVTLPSRAMRIALAFALEIDPYPRLLLICCFFLPVSSTGCPFSFAFSPGGSFPFNLFFNSRNPFPRWAQSFPPFPYSFYFLPPPVMSSASDRAPSPLRLSSFSLSPLAGLCPFPPDSPQTESVVFYISLLPLVLYGLEVFPIFLREGCF